MNNIESILETIEVDRQETMAEVRILDLLTGINHEDGNIQQILDDVAYHAATRTYNYLKGD